MLIILGIIFSIGINDSIISIKEKISRTEIDIFRKNIEALIKKAKLYTQEVLFIGLTPVDESIRFKYKDKSFTNKRIEEFNNVIKEICQKKIVSLFLICFKNFQD